MRKRQLLLRNGALVLLATAAAGAFAEPGTSVVGAPSPPDLPVDTAQPLEEVLVSGEQPGPGLWKVTRPDDADGHVLWILSDHRPLPKGFVWKKGEVEAVVASSTEVIAPPSVDAAFGPLGGVTLLPSLIGIRRNPDGAMLREVVPAELYDRWLPLKREYLGKDDDVEEWRPIFAAQELYVAALKRQGLVPYPGVWPQVEKIAKRRKVPVREPQVKVDVRKPREAIREFKDMPLDDVECFARTLKRFDKDLGLLRERANAWAVGDVARLRELAPVERASACIAAVLDSSIAQQRGLGDVVQRARDTWHGAVLEALARNPSTLAVTSLDELLRPGGHLERLRSAGYRVDDP